MQRSVLLVCSVSLAATLAAQGYTTNFEGPAFLASPAGTAAAGQDGFYVPAVAGSIDGALFTYAGNALGVPANPNGGASFWGGLSAGGTAFARSQRALSLPSTRIKIDYDVCCNYLGAAVPTNNIGSFSFQPSTNAIYVNLLAAYPLAAPFPPTVWQADVVTRGAVPPATVTTVLPDPAFQNLAMNVWHHWSVTIDMIAGTHESFSITNGVTNITTTHVPTTPLLLPIAPGIGAPLPTDFRFFAGGTTAGNVFAVDNLRITYAAAYTAFGAGCPGALGIPTLTATTLPVLGGNLSVTLGNLPVGVGLMISGTSNTLLGGSIPLPLPLASLGFPGCNLLVDPLATATVVGAAPTAVWNLPIPGNPTLLGVVLYQQGASLDPGPAFLAFSAGADFQIGL